MMPNTSVSPAASRNSSRPNCNPFRSCSMTRYMNGLYQAETKQRQRECAAAGVISFAPPLRGEGWGEGLSPRIELAESPPHPDRKSDPTSPRRRGEVTRDRPPDH